MSEHLVVNIGSGRIEAEGWPAVASLSAKIARIMGTIRPVHKDARHEKQGWTYASYGEVADEIRKAMAQANLSLGVVVEDVVQAEAGTGLHNAVSLTFVLLDGDSGALMLCPWRGEAVDFGTADKGLNKAITSASKYFLMRTFLVSTVDEVDADGQGDDKTPTRIPVKAQPVATRQEAATVAGPREVATGEIPASARRSLSQAEKGTLDAFRRALNAQIVKLADEYAVNMSGEDLRHYCLRELAGVGRTADVPLAQYGQVIGGLRKCIGDLMAQQMASEAEESEDEMGQT